MVKLITGSIGTDVHEYTNTPWGAALDIEFPRADQWNVAQTGLSRRGSGKYRVNVVGRGEQRADQIVLGELVAFEHRLEQGDDPLEDLLGRVLVDRRRPTQCSHIRHSR